ncbi:hypothetical protein PMAC_002754 [Pneumocystis sp. 'macacae']|nr:hypothetical protein PMAC_002754 [Pneumocystis sp. 'macacae']
MQRMLYLPLHAPCTYAAAAAIQESWVGLFLAHKQWPETHPKPPALLIVSQFEPTYTCGRRESDRLSKIDAAYLRTNPSAVLVRTLRGGQITFHGPGQIVGYPILDLVDFQMTLKEYVDRLELSVLRTCNTFGLTAILTEHRGVWISPTKKIASIGLHLRRHITSHGIALNVSTNLNYFNKITACGLENKEMTSFEREGVKVPLEIVQSCWVTHLVNVLQCTVQEINIQEVKSFLSS